jgi:hypothetical protein
LATECKKIEGGARNDVNELIREETERIVAVGIEAEAINEENEEGLNDRGDDDAEDEYFGPEAGEEEDEKEQFEMDDGRRLGVEVVLEGKLLKRKEELLNLKKDNRYQEFMRYQKSTFMQM